MAACLCLLPLLLHQPCTACQHHSPSNDVHAIYLHASIMSCPSNASTAICLIWLNDVESQREQFHEKNGGVGSQIGLRALELKPPAIFTADDWEKYVVRNGLADEDDCIGDAREGGRVRRAKK